MERKKTFTLSEVLITLVIVGIVAAITVPLIYASYTKEVTVQKLKKAYVTVCEIVKLSELDNGPLKDWEFDKTTNIEGVNSDFFKKYFEPYIVGMKKYGTNTSDKVAYPVNNIDGKYIFNILTWYILSDGTSVSMFSDGTDYCWIFVDINGSNNPNSLGKDIFMLEIQRKKTVIFSGHNVKDKSNDTDRNYSCKKATGQRFAGGYCGAWIQAAGWKIPDGYPW